MSVVAYFSHNEPRTEDKWFFWNKRPFLACTCICRTMFFVSLNFIVGSCASVSDVLLAILVFLLFEFASSDHFVCWLVTPRSNNGRRRHSRKYVCVCENRDELQVFSLKHSFIPYTQSRYYITTNGSHINVLAAWNHVYITSSPL